MLSSIGPLSQSQFVFLRGAGGPASASSFLRYSAPSSTGGGFGFSSGMVHRLRAKLKRMDATLELAWRDPDGIVRRKSLPWRNKPHTNRALSEYLTHYLTRVAAGYKPPGFDIAPVPHCARIKSAGALKAEWVHPDRSVCSPPIVVAIQAAYRAASRETPRDRPAILNAHLPHVPATTGIEPTR